MQTPIVVRYRSKQLTSAVVLLIPLALFLAAVLLEAVPTTRFIVTAWMGIIVFALLAGASALTAIVSTCTVLPDRLVVKSLSKTQEYFYAGCAVLCDYEEVKVAYTKNFKFPFRRVLLKDKASGAIAQIQCECSPQDFDRLAQAILAASTAVGAPAIIKNKA